MVYFVLQSILFYKNGGENVLNGIFRQNTLLEKSLDASWVRNEVVSENLANVDTPGYKRKVVEFESLLKDALENRLDMKTSHSRHIRNDAASVINSTGARIKRENKDFNLRLDGNNVDIDNEMSALAKNTIKYNTLVQSLNLSMRRIKMSVNEGRK